MTEQTVVAAILLALGVGTVLICCVGVLIASGTGIRLRYVSVAATGGSIAVAAAILVQDGFGPAGIRALLVAGVLSVTNPVMNHATARAMRSRHAGHWHVSPTQEEQSE